MLKRNPYWHPYVPVVFTGCRQRVQTAESDRRRRSALYARTAFSRRCSACPIYSVTAVRSCVRASVLAKGATDWSLGAHVWWRVGTRQRWERGLGWAGRTVCCGIPRERVVRKVNRLMSLGRQPSVY